VVMYDKLQQAILCDLYDTQTTGMPIRGTGHLASLSKSTTLHILFGSPGYKRFLSELNAFANSLDQPLEAVIPDQLFSAVLYRLTKENQNALSVAAEVFLQQLVQDASLDMVFGHAFFNDCKAINVLQLINSLNATVACLSITDVHRHSPCYAPHISGPLVTACGSCGVSFITFKEVADFPNLDNIPQSVIDGIKKKTYRTLQTNLSKSRRCHPNPSVFSL